MDRNPAIVLFREDLRLADHPALSAAVDSDSPLVLLYVHDEASPFPHGGARRWWLHHSLTALSDRVLQRGAKLNILRGNTESLVKSVITETNAKSVYWTRRYAPHQIEKDRSIKSALKGSKIHAVSKNGRLLSEPWKILTHSGNPYRIFTPFYRRFLQLRESRFPLPAPELHNSIALPHSLSVEDLGLLPANPDWTIGFTEHWTPGEQGAMSALEQFLAKSAKTYKQDRDYPALAGTSFLSPHLQMGEISPLQILSRYNQLHDMIGASNAADKFLSELAWREFSYHLLFHFPSVLQQPFQPNFKMFPWRENHHNLRAWQTGRTGYPIVDAGMRQLWHTGYMHNRVRMITASFLTKHLLINWQRGAEWFWDTLVDADIASNTIGWQWTAGCGPDAAPFFRIFNPILQAQRFDPEGTFIRKWVPELSRLPAAYLKAPWTAPSNVLSSAGIALGATYPYPIINHEFARSRALSAYAEIK